ncbi:MAG TPA: DUF397 domain-containing protein [Pseudonocardiaceae bacterium]|nr:DUF397 domain-containing protein [Pseudonocardiaceae bacterium]
MTSADLSRAIWRKSSRSAGNGGTDDCVEWAALADSRVAVRDSKCPEGAVLVFHGIELAAWISSVKNHEFAR